MKKLHSKEGAQQRHHNRESKNDERLINLAGGNHGARNLKEKSEVRKADRTSNIGETLRVRAFVRMVPSDPSSLLNEIVAAGRLNSAVRFCSENS